MTEKPIPLDELDISEHTLHIPASQVRTRSAKSGLKLFCDKEGFVVKKGNTVKRVPSYDTDKLFRGRDLKQIAKYALLNNKFKVSEFDNGEYAIHAQGELKGGGPGGASAGFYVGKFLTHLVGHGAIQIAAVCTGPGYAATVVSLEATFGPGIEAASNVVGLGTGMVGGVATGPA